MLTIRAAQAGDATEIAECACESFSHYSARIGKKPGPMLYDYAQCIKEDQVHVAVDANSAIAGFLVLQVEEKADFHLKCVAVHPSWQNKGLGRRLLELAESEALRQGYASITLCTNEAMVENQAIYQSFGYKECSRRTEDGYARIYYNKKLAPRA